MTTLRTRHLILGATLLKLTNTVVIPVFIFFGDYGPGTNMYKRTTAVSTDEVDTVGKDVVLGTDVVDTVGTGGAASFDSSCVISAVGGIYMP